MITNMSDIFVEKLTARLGEKSRDLRRVESRGRARVG